MRGRRGWWAGRWRHGRLRGRSGAQRGMKQGTRLTLVRTCRGPLNEDVFSAQQCPEEKALHPSVQELTEQIHRLLLQVGAPPASPPAMSAPHAAAGPTLWLHPPRPACSARTGACSPCSPCRLGTGVKSVLGPRLLGTPAARPVSGSPSLALLGCLSLSCSPGLVAEG